MDEGQRPNEPAACAFFNKERANPSFDEDFHGEEGQITGIISDCMLLL